jgi:hypothetical protein
MSESNSKIDFARLLIIPVAIIAAAIVILLWLPSKEAVVFPIVVILGVIILVATLVIAAVTLRQLNISCKTEALGLPAGSIRSLIALSLIIIFVMLAIFLYPGMSSQVSQFPSNVTIIYPNGTITSTYNSTSILVEPSEAQKNFSLQALTTISTLVVAIASFYFGSKAVESARSVSGSATIAKIVTNPSGSADAVKGSPLTIKLENIPENVAVDTWKIYGDSKGILVMDRHNIFKYTPSEEAQNEVLLSFGVAKNENIKGELYVTINEKKKAEVQTPTTQTPTTQTPTTQAEDEKTKVEDENKKTRKTPT